MYRHILHICALLCAVAILAGPPRLVFASAGADAQSRAIVQAADSFVATLTVAQRQKAMFDWSNTEQRRNWSNLPEGIVRRGGVKWGDLDETQRAALITLLHAVLSDDGVDMVRMQMLADETLVRGGGGRPSFGADQYFVSILGTPSTTSPWMLQFGGHHLAINATMSGSNLTLSPTLTGGQPLRFEAEGRQIYLTKTEIDAAHALLDSLTPTQRTQALVSGQLAQLQLGPGQDGRTLAAEGVRVSTFNAAQRERLTALIAARLGILNADDRTPLMREITAQFDQSTFGWWGPMSGDEPAYWRIAGPRLALEYSPQSAEHVHSIYRDPQNDYGAAWARN